MERNIRCPSNARPPTHHAPHSLTPNARRLFAALALALPLVLTGHNATPARAGDCPIFPASNVWNADISALPVADNSDAMIAAIGLNSGLHPDFGTDPTYGIPYVAVPGDQPQVSVDFQYADESDPGPYPIPDDPPIEEADGHIIMVDRDNCYLYGCSPPERK